MIVEEILIQAGVDYKQVRDEIIMPCPFCAGQHDTESARRVFGINLISGKAHCYRCDRGFGSLTYTLKALCETFGIDYDMRLRLAATQMDAVEKPEPVPVITGLPEEYEKFINSGDFIENKARAYLRERNIGKSLIRRYHIGYAAVGFFAWRIIIPVVGPDGEVYGVVGRDFSGKAKKKYLNTEAPAKILFGVDTATERSKVAVVHEGPLDSLRASGRLWPVYGDTVVSVASLGSSITRIQIEQMQRFKTAVHFPDFDVPGVEGMIRRAEATAEAGIQTMVVVPEGLTGDDPDSLSAESYMRHLKAAKLWGPAARLRLRRVLLS